MSLEKPNPAIGGGAGYDLFGHASFPSISANYSKRQIIASYHFLPTESLSIAIELAPGVNGNG